MYVLTFVESIQSNNVSVPSSRLIARILSEWNKAWFVELVKVSTLVFTYDDDKLLF